MKVLDVGGHHQTYKKATRIIDIRPKPKDCKLNYTQMDICLGKWPYQDKEFDFVWCSNTLEDVRDPIIVCKEMMRVGKAGRIIVPSPLTECTIGAEKGFFRPEKIKELIADKYAGFWHHRWLCFINENEILFMQKTPMTHIFDWTSHIPDGKKRDMWCKILDWKDSFEVSEEMSLGFMDMYNILKEVFGIDPAEDIIQAR